MGKLENKVAIITGSTSGIGKESAIRFAKEGAKIVVVGRNEERGAEVVKTIEDNGSDAIFIQADMKDVSNADMIISKTIERFGKLDILYSNAGMVINYDFPDYTEEMYDEVMTVDLKMPFVLTQKALPYLMETQGVALYTSSVAGHSPLDRGYLYSMSKCALTMMAKCLAAHYAEKNVRFISISPGMVDTPIFGPIPKEILDNASQVVPAKRWAKPEEIANLAVFLASDEAAYINGSDVVIDGGYCVKF